MGNNLYTPAGWLNFNYIADRGAWLNIIIGARQVGKTYGVLKYVLDNNIQHVLLRRTTAELDTITASPEISPYKVFEPEYKTGIFRQAKKLCKISDYVIDEKGKPQLTIQRGIATSLAEISHIRGFAGGTFTDLIFDEFIPEKSIITRSTEGDAFLNAYTTINSNRELDGRPPLRAWLLANSNRIDSSILEALDLTDIILYMRRKELEEYKTEDGALIIQPKSAGILAQRAETALMKRVNSKSEFYGMAIENDFSYDQSPYIKTLPLKNMVPEWSYNNIYCWAYSGGFYICRAPFKSANARKYEPTRTGRESLAIDYPILKAYYYAGMIAFSDLRALSLFKQIFDIA